MSYQQEELIARASDPQAPLTTLHQLAQNYPGLRPYIAANPRTYPALLEWLGTLGDPAVDAALARRAAGLPGIGETPGTAGAHAAGAHATEVGSTGGPGSAALGSAAAATSTAAQTGETAGGVASTAAFDATSTHTDVDPGDATGTAVLPEGADAAGATAVFSAGDAASTETPSDQDLRATTVTPMALLAEEAPTAIQTSAQDARPAFTPVATTEPASPQAGSNDLFSIGHQDAERGPSTLGIWILAALAIVLAVAIAVFFILGNKKEPQPTPPDTIQAAATTAAPATPSAIATPAPQSTPITAPEPTTTPTPEIVAPAPEGAQNLASFAAPSGNISCTLDAGSTRCTIGRYNFTPHGDSCAAGQPYSITLNADGTTSTDCTSDLTDASALSYGQAAANSDFACTSEQSGITCWSQTTGRGFTLAREGVRTITR